MATNMKNKYAFLLVIIFLAGLVLAAARSPYARRIRPVAAFGTCIENEIAYDMVLHKGGICTNTGYKDILISGGDINGLVFKGGTPGIAGNGTLNTGSKDSAGKVTTTGTGASTIVLTFSTAFPRAPACLITNETTANLVRPISTTTTLTVAATIVTGDSLSYICAGY